MQRNTITKLTPYVLLAVLTGCASIGRSLKKTLTGNQERAHVVIQPTEWVRGHVATWQQAPVVLSIDGIPALSFGGGYGPYDVLPGTHTFVVAVTWSNGWKDETELPFAAQAGKEYLLLTYERAPGEPEEKAGVRKRTITEKAVGVVVLSVLLSPPVSLLTLPYVVGTALQRLVEQPGTTRPFERCCFVWIQEEESGVVVGGERPGGGVHP